MGTFNFPGLGFYFDEFQHHLVTSNPLSYFAVSSWGRSYEVPKTAATHRVSTKCLSSPPLGFIFHKSQNMRALQPRLWCFLTKAFIPLVPSVKLVDYMKCLTPMTFPGHIFSQQSRFLLQICFSEPSMELSLAHHSHYFTKCECINGSA